MTSMEWHHRLKLRKRRQAAALQTLRVTIYLLISRRPGRDIKATQKELLDAGVLSRHPASSIFRS
jgi:hypothetical protein